MSKKKEKKPKVTDAQIDVLCTFFEENPEVLVGCNKNPKSLKAVFAKWQKVTPYLNSLGVQKIASEWTKYLRSHRAKLKLKRFKWKQKQDGSGPMICNADDFSEIGFRMLQVFRRNVNTPQDLQNSNTSFNGSEDNVKAEHSNELEKIIIKQEPNKDCDSNDVGENEKNQAIPMATRTFLKPDEETSQVFVNTNEIGDDFDTFARNMAQQLRALPMDIALETQEMMWAILFKQRLKVNDVGDPLDKKNG